MTNTTGPDELRRLADSIPDTRNDAQRASAFMVLAAAWEADRAALERARALVASNSVPHSQWCLIKHGGPCDCYKAHLAAALGSGGAA